MFYLIFVVPLFYIFNFTERLFVCLDSPPPAIKAFLISTTLALSAFSLNAQATLTSYTANGKDLVYSSVSNVTWTKDGNLLGTLFASQGFNTVVNAIIAASPTISNTPNVINPSGTYSLSANDFSSDGITTWFGALAYVNYLNSINYAGSNKWYLPTVANTTFGFNTATNGIAKGDELPELFYAELGGTAGRNIPNTPTFDNEQASNYWSGTEYAPDPGSAWGFDTFNGGQSRYGKSLLFYAWAVSPGQIAAVPEPEFGAMLLLGLGMVAFASRRRRG